MHARSTVTVIILAAGLSRRAAPHNKLLRPAPDGSGRSVVRALAESVVDAGVGEVVVVSGHQRERVEATLAGLPIQFVFATDYANGMGHSLAAGVRAAATAASGFAIVPGDLPDLSSSLVRSIVERFVAEQCSKHVIPTVRGERGHPVVLGAWLRPQLVSLTGDTGARGLLAAPAEAARCVFFEVDDPAILRDVDAG